MPLRLLSSRCPLFHFLLAATLLTGCAGQQGPPTYPVSGEVTWEGEPLEKGRIIFEPLTADGTRPASGSIEQGQFSFQIEEGEKRVRVIAEREVGPADPVMGAPRRENFIPPRYNEESELQVEVTPEGENVYSFELSDD